MQVLLFSYYAIRLSYSYYTVLVQLQPAGRQHAFRSDTVRRQPREELGSPTGSEAGYSDLLVLCAIRKMQETAAQTP